MKFIHSLGFLFIGLVMYKLPQLVPGLCPPGMLVRETWLHVMGFTQIVIGSSYGLRGATILAAGWLERWPELVAATLAGSTPQPEDPIPAIATARTAEVIPVDFKPAWSEQRNVA